MAFPGIDQEHLSCCDLTTGCPIVEMQEAHRDDQRNRDGVAVLGNLLPGLEAQANDAHGSTVGDLLEADGTARSFRTLR